MDALRQLQFEDAVARQEAIVGFMLGCQRMAIDLRQMCNARRCASHPVDSLESCAELVAAEIAKEFRRAFGYPLFHAPK